MTETRGLKTLKQGEMLTYSGKIINLFNIDPDLISLEDIAHGLANLCRWNGATKSFYSVAEHCMRVADLVPEGYKLEALFHDSEEAYWGDMIGPLKDVLKKVAPEIVEMMVHTRHLIFEKYCIRSCPDVIDKADVAELHWEYKNIVVEGLHVGLSPSVASANWLMTAKIYLGYE